MKTRSCATALAYVFAMLPLALAQVIVRGVITDSSGMGVPNALVEAMPRNERDSAAIGSRGKWTAVDDHGRFTLMLLPGRYKLVAKDEVDGYPDPVFALCADPGANFPTITVGQANVSDVRVILGAPGGVLEGQVIDRLAGSPVAKAKITISDAGNPQAYVEVFSDPKGQFRFTVPSKPISVSVTAGGYVAAQPIGGGDFALAGGEHRNVVVEIDRKATSH